MTRPPPPRPRIDWFRTIFWICTIAALAAFWTAVGRAVLS